MINLMNHLLFWDSVRLILSVCETDDELCSSQSWLPGDFREPDTEFPSARPLGVEWHNLPKAFKKAKEELYGVYGGRSEGLA